MALIQPKQLIRPNRNFAGKHTHYLNETGTQCSISLFHFTSSTNSYEDEDEYEDNNDDEVKEEL